MSKRTLGIVTALSAEARALTGAPQPVARLVRLSEKVLMWLGGMGDEAAGRACAALVDAGADALASVGTAAGLAPGCRSGTLALPRKILSSSGEVFGVDAGWREALQAALDGCLEVTSGPLAGAETVIDVAGKQALAAQTGAVAADMESLAVAREASRRGIPVLVIRAVSDGPLDEVPPAAVCSTDSFGRPRYLPLAWALARHPGDLRPLLRLASGFKTALSTLSAVAARAGPRLGCP
jgi:adenosylhomocysteine nucleosidase